MNKTRLLYIWIDKYKALENIGINLTADYTFNCVINIFDNKKSIELSQEAYFPEKISELKNIIALVGENGTGKSSILEVMSKVIAKEYNPFGFCIFEYMDERGVTIELVIEKKEKSISKLESSFLDLKKNTSSQNFKIKTKVNEKDNTLGCVIYNSNEDKIISIDKLSNDMNVDNIYSSTLRSFSYNQPHLLFDNLDLIKNIFEGSNYEKIKVVYPINTRDLQKFIGRLEKINLDHNYDIETYLQSIGQENIGVALNTLEDNLTNLSNKSDINDSYINQAIISIFEYHFDRCLDLARILSYMYLAKNDNFNSFCKSLDYPFLDLTESVEGEISFVKSIIERHKHCIKSDDINGLRLEYDKDNIDPLKQLQREKNPHDFYFLSPMLTGISSGQLSLFKLFYGIKNTKLAELNSLVILLDEAEQTLHPEWQRQFVYCLLKFQKQHLSEYTNVQVVFSTHSPFLLTDVLDENIVYLKLNSDEVPVVVLDKLHKKKSFAANIHELLIDNFYMKRTIGENATQIIISLFSKLLKGDITPDVINDSQSIIDRISDKIIHSELQRLLNEKSPKFKNNKIELVRQYFEKNNLKRDDLKAIEKIIKCD